MGAEYVFNWYSNQAGRNDNTFHKQTGVKAVPMAVSEENLVHHFDKLKGGKLKQGGILHEDMKVIRQVVLAGKDAHANNECGCDVCGEEDPDADFVDCTVCGAWRHIKCAGPGAADAEEWWCEKCSKKLD